MSPRLLHFEPSHAELYREKPFKLATSLADHPLLSMDAIRDLALRLPRAKVFFSSGELDIGDDFDNAHRTKTTGLSLEETLANMEAAGSYLFIREPNHDPEYDGLFRELLTEVREFKDALDPGVTEAMLYMFVASPGSQTPFHVDRYQTFLFQISGTKVVSLWDRNDARVVSDAQMDALFAFDKEGEPAYRPGVETLSTPFEMEPGDGLHIPLGAPHAVVSGDEVSVGLSIIFRTAASERLAAAHRYNHGQRRKGRTPRPAGSSATVDGAKQAMLRAKDAARRVLRR